MKNLAWILLPLLAASCARSGEETLPPKRAAGNKLVCTLETPEGTRSGMNAAGRFVWKAGDAVGVMSSVQLDANIPYQLDPACADSEQGVFVGGATTIRAGDVYYAYYPYAQNARITGDRKIRMTVPAVQTYEPASFPTMANPTVSVSATADAYAFKNTCGFLKILLTGDAAVTEIVLRAGLKNASADPYATMLSGSGDVDLAAADPVLALDESYGDNAREIKINCGAGVRLTSGVETPFIAVVPPATYRPMTVEVRLSTGEVYSYMRADAQREVVVERNRITTFSLIDIAETPLTVVEEVGGVYTVRTPSEWNWIAVQVDNGETFAGKTVSLAADLDFDGLRFIPMGCSADYMTDTGAGENFFMGTLDGKGRKFLNVSIDKSDGRGRGIVGQSKNAEIRNVTVENMKIVGPGKWTGGLVGLMSGGTISSCRVKGIDIDPVEPNGGYLSYRLGGLVGLLNDGPGTIAQCSVEDAVIRGAAVMGGLVGSIVHGQQTAIEHASVANIRIYHKDTDFTVRGHYGSFDPPYYVSAPLVGEADATVTLTDITIGEWGLYDETLSTRRLTEQTFTALPYAGLVDTEPVSVDGVQLMPAAPAATTERTILGNGATILPGAN